MAEGAHLVSQDISIGAKALMATVSNEIGFSINYNMVRRAKQKVVERMFRTFKMGTTLCLDCSIR